LLFANIKEENTKHTAMKFNTKVIHGGSSMIQLQSSNAPVFKRQHFKQVLENLLVIMATVVQQIPQEQL
jgi:hypothetical protein